MDNIYPELLLKIASESQFTWRPLLCVNKHINEVLRQYNMYDYISGAIFICFGSQDDHNAFVNDGIMRPDELCVFSPSLKEKFKSGCIIKIVYDWEIIKKYITKKSSDCWIVDVNNVLGPNIDLRHCVLFKYYICFNIFGESIRMIPCDIIEYLDNDIVDIYYAQFIELLKYIPNLDYIRYIIGDKYIPHL